MTNLMHDFRYALRTLARTPALSAISILALTLGTGIPTMMFTVVNGVFRELPFQEPDRLMRLFATDLEQGSEQWSVSHHDFADWRAELRAFDGVAGFMTEDVTLSGGDAPPIRRDAAFVTGTIFNVLGVPPILGRPFNEQDAGPAAPAVAVISHALWQLQFGGDPNVTSRPLSVDGVPRAIVGVMPPRFGFPQREDVWLPLALTTAGPRAAADDLQVVGRLARGATVEQANTELRTIAARLAAAFPETNENLGAGTRRYSESVINPVFARGLFTMLGAVSFVLLIACINVAHLSLARAIKRSHEIAVRAAMGASRPRLVSLFILEAVPVVVAGGLFGTALAWLGASTFGDVLVSSVNLAWIDLRLDWRVLAFVLGAVTVSGLVAGVLPAARAWRVNVSGALKDVSRSVAGAGSGMGRFTRGLVIAEVAASCALLVTAGLMIKGVLKLQAIDLGIPAAELMTGEVEIPREIYASAEARVRFFEELERTAAVIPGVTGVAFASDIPGTIGFRLPFSVEGREEPTAPVAMLTVTPAFFDVLGATLLAGRGFHAGDRAGSAPVIIVNQRFAERYFAGQPPVSRVVEYRGMPRTVVGVAPDLLMGAIDQPGVNGAGVYFPMAQTGPASMQVIVRTAGDPLRVAPQVRAAVATLDPSVALMDVGRIDRLIARETAAFQVLGALFLGFGLVALLLASMGLYGVMAFTMQQRTREWGVRMALGATRQGIVAAAMRRGALDSGLGLTLGFVIAGMLSIPLAQFFYQVEPWDGAVFVVIGAILTLTSLIATLVPARRATRLDPLAALRED